jgi:AcrR family transcriptional regulator
MKVQDPLVKDADLVVQRRAEIIKAALRVFSERGYQAARTQDVCAAAKVAQGTLYNYVRSKEDLLYLICDELVSARMAGLQASLKETTDPKQRLVMAIRANIETSRKYPHHTRLVFRENHGLPPKARDAIRKRIAEHIDEMRAILIEAKKAGCCHFENAHLAANICTFLPSMTALRHWSLDGQVPVSKLEDAMLAATLRAVGCEPA